MEHFINCLFNPSFGCNTLVKPLLRISDTCWDSFPQPDDSLFNPGGDPRSSPFIAASTPSRTPQLGSPGLPTPPLSPLNAYCSTGKVPSAVAEGRTKAAVEHAKLGPLQKATVPACSQKTKATFVSPMLTATTPVFSPSRGRSPSPPLTPITPLRVMKKPKAAGAKAISEVSSKSASVQGLGLVIDRPTVGQTSTIAPSSLAPRPSVGRRTPSPPHTPIKPLRLVAKPSRAGNTSANLPSKASARHPLESRHATTSPTQVDNDRLRAIELKTLVLELNRKLEAERAKSTTLEKRVEQLESTAPSAIGIALRDLRSTFVGDIFLIVTL
ncbi:hypothetical protein FRB90_003285 [Tulasnella sp. 427]|nr:hypothetical protein FRB90_003285 [Tulasnella sp. 427]